MSKSSSRSISKKFLPKELVRITEDGKRVWAFDSMRFDTLQEFDSRVRNAVKLNEDNIVKEEIKEE